MGRGRIKFFPTLSGRKKHAKRWLFVFAIAILRTTKNFQIRELTFPSVYLKNCTHFYANFLPFLCAFCIDFCDIWWFYRAVIIRYLLACNWTQFLATSCGFWTRSMDNNSCATNESFAKSSLLAILHYSQLVLCVFALFLIFLNITLCLRVRRLKMHENLKVKSKSFYIYDFPISIQAFYFF